MRAILLVAAGLATQAAAFSPTAPQGADQTAMRSDPPALYATAIGPASAMAAPTELTLEGGRTRRAYRAAQGTALDLLQDLRRQLTGAGFEVLFTCSATTCGGFDFRSTRPLLPMPQMIVGLAGYSYLAASRGPAGAPDAAASVLVSDTPAGAFAQLTLIDTAAAPGAPAPAGKTAADLAGATGRNPQGTAASASPGRADAVSRSLADNGRFVLDGLSFASGTAELSGPAPAGIAALAQWLEADASRRIALVGHTDWTGSSEMNRDLSRRRARAVAAQLTDRFGIASDRIEVEGAGPFAPRESNATAEGRAANRRVEAVALPPRR